MKVAFCFAAYWLWKGDVSSNNGYVSSDRKHCGLRCDDGHTWGETSSPTSCFLFIIFVNELIRVMKEKCQAEPLLEWLHIMMLMDDTVLLSTSRCKMIKKVQVLKQFCEKYGMVINSSKTKFFVINGEEEDKQPLCVDELVIEHCTSYTYLRSPTHR